MKSLKDVAKKKTLNYENLCNFVIKNNYAYSKGIRGIQVEDNQVDEIVKNYKAMRRAERQLNEDFKQEAASMMITSGFSFDGYTISRYSGYISADDVIQVDRTKGWTNSAVDVGPALKDALQKLRKNALNDLKQQAFDLGCNAIIGVNFDYMTLDPITPESSNVITYLPYVFCVTANGNPVVVEEIDYDDEYEDEDEYED